MQTIKIFLGSSITELHDERVILGDYLMNSVRPIFKQDGIEVEVHKCEDIRSGNTGVPPQNKIDKLLRECDVSVFMFKCKAGDMTVHEFDVARKLQKRKRHEIYVYCFNVQEADKSQELKDYQDRLIKEHFYCYACKDVNDLKSQFVLGLLKLERQLLGKRTAKDIEQESITEKDGDTLFAEYELNEQTHEQKQALLREKIHQHIDELQQQTETVMTNEDETIAARIFKVIELYKKADQWAAATAYDKEKYFYLLSDYAWFLDEYGLYHDAEVVNLRQINLAEELFGNEHEITATSYNNIGGIYWKQSDYDKTIEYLHKALTIRERIFGTKHSETATIYNNLGLVYKNKGDYNKALEFHFKALEIREKELGMENPSIAQSNMNIASVYYDLDEYNKALKYYQKALAIFEESLGTEDPSTATTYNDIGLVYLSQGDYDNALTFILKALAIREKKFGTDNPETAISFNGLGMLYNKQNNFGKAMEYLFKALAIREKHLDKEHPSIATSYYEIGLVYQAQGNYNTALDYYNKAYQIRKKKLGEGHPYTKAVLKSINIVKKVLDSND